MEEKKHACRSRRHLESQVWQPTRGDGEKNTFWWEIALWQKYDRLFHYRLSISFSMYLLCGDLRAMDLTGAESWRWRGRERRYCRVNLADLEMRFVTCARLLPYPLLTKCFVSKSNHGATNHQQVILRMKSLSFHFHFMLCFPFFFLLFFFFDSLLYFFVDTVLWHYMRSPLTPPPPA